jgi:dGTPase
MNNSFYSAFDLERMPEPKTRPGDYRSVFQIERDRVIFSYPFRRLQSKTQVFQAGEYDFYRTRLTHSIEVAKIGRSICDWLRHSSGALGPEFFIDPDLTAAIGLAHDLGHPPFGHIGERRLNELMAPHGGFEGNAQTLRILTELIYERPGHTEGVAPTRAFLDGVMKYKALHRERTGAGNDGKPAYPANHFLYDDQAAHRATVFGGAEPPATLARPDALNAFKSIECQVMDWADDTAYSLNDIVDGIHARYINLGSLETWAADHGNLGKNEAECLDTLARVLRENRFEPYFGARIGDFVHACSLRRRDGFLADRSHRHAFDLVIDPALQEESALYKRIALDLIFRSPQIQQIEFKGGFILTRLFNALAEQFADGRPDGLRILPHAAAELIHREETRQGRFRRLCDALAGLTDGQAVRTYKRLFDPDFGSIAELL